MPDLAESWLWIAAAVWYGGVNLAALCVFAWDKRAAVRGAWRVRVRTLLGLVWPGGVVGAFVAMRWARHKTAKGGFRLTPWSAAVVQVGAWLVLARTRG